MLAQGRAKATLRRQASPWVAYNDAQIALKGQNNGCRTQRNHMPRFKNFTVPNERMQAVFWLPVCTLAAALCIWLVIHSLESSLCLLFLCAAGFTILLLTLLHRLFHPEIRIECNSKEVCEADILELAEIPIINSLDLRGTVISKSGFQALSKLQHVYRLGLSETNFTDEDSNCLRSINGLELLDLEQTQITDVTLERLAGLTTLRCVLLGDTGVTEEGNEKLRKSIFGLFTDETYWN